MPFILCMKGLEIGTGKRLTTVMKEVLGPHVRTIVWVGPGHVQDFLAGMPNCMVMASDNLDRTKHMANLFSSPLIRFYYGKDLLGTEIGAAAKNVIGIARRLSLYEPQGSPHGPGNARAVAPHRRHGRRRHDRLRLKPFRGL